MSLKADKHIYLTAQRYVLRKNIITIEIEWEMRGKEGNKEYTKKGLM